MLPLKLSILAVMDSVKLSKKTLRLKISKIKKSYSKEELKTMSVPIIKKLLSDSLFIESSTILLYNSLPDEVCTHHLLQMCCQEKQILLPTVVGDKLEIHIYDPDKTATGPYGITERRGPLFTEYEIIDLAIIPGVAFDPMGNRLGRGKGYYDKLLPFLRCVKYGICFDFQFVETIPTDSHDIKVDKIIH